jgi:hypothetical protein
MDSNAQIAGTFTEIDVLKPYRMERRIESLQPLPHVAPESQHCAGRLIHIG